MPLPAARFSAVRSPFKFSLGLAAAFVLVACLPSSRALSWPLCAEGSSSWVTENPFTAPIFPGANLWFFCRAGINVAGSAVDACYSRGSVCDQDAAADALCAVVGYDRAVYDETSLAVVSGTGCAIRSLTGEYTLGGGSYSITKPDPKLAQGCTPRPLGSESRLPVPGLQANDVVVLDGITCVRSINTIRRHSQQSQSCPQQSQSCPQQPQSCPKQPQPYSQQPQPYSQQSQSCPKQSQSCPKQSQF
ncbi:hypothetical protein H632_c344p0 [Helicosporidium sp. ATCC 50920]|nr:hypothetical protein H632_c344p0 [Helicosporidium sp. ATCC 50920]|eukprot:KDD76127.1 hypothetical protein H632_c344p0 [Helicosporidium sp. ATCC 50920]